MKKKARSVPKLHPSVPRSIAIQTHKVFDAKQSKENKRIVNDAKRYAKVMDGFENFASRVGLNTDNALSAGLYAFNMMTKNRVQLEAAFRGSWVVGAVINSKAEDMTRAGVQISTNEQAQNIPEIQAALSRLKVFQSLCSGLKWGDLYGGAIGVIQIKGQDLATPLDPERVGKGQFQGVAVYDRWQLNPDLQECIDSGPDMGLPKYYYLVTTSTNLATTSGVRAQTSEELKTGQIKIHFSRIARFIGIELPYFQAINEMMWGESVLEQMWDRLISFDTATMSSANLINRAQLRTVRVEGLREILAAGGKAQQSLEAMFDLMRILQVNEGLTLLDKEDEFQSTAYSFAGLSDMMLQFGQQLSGASGIPLVRLFGQSPAGLSATGESDMRMYYDNIKARQEAKLRNPMELILKVLWRSLFGKDAPKDLLFEFTPLWQMTALDKATIAKSNAETITGVHDSGLISDATAMKELRMSSGDTGLFSNITDEEIAGASEELPPPVSETQTEPGGDDEEKGDVVKNFDAAGAHTEKFEQAVVVGKKKVKDSKWAHLTPAQRIEKWLSEN